MNIEGAVRILKEYASITMDSAITEALNEVMNYTKEAEQSKKELIRHIEDKRREIHRERLNRETLYERLEQYNKPQALEEKERLWNLEGLDEAYISILRRLEDEMHNV